MLLKLERTRLQVELVRVRELSPVVLRRKMNGIRRKIASLEKLRPAANDNDRNAPEVIRKAEEDLSRRLSVIEAEIRSIQSDPASTKRSFNLLGMLVGQPVTEHLTSAAANRLLTLEHERRVVRVALNPPDATPISEGMEDLAVFEGWRISPRRRLAANHEHNLDLQVSVLKIELELYEEAVGFQDRHLEHLESFKARSQDESRQLAQKLRMTLSSGDRCPYCESKLEVGSVLDHIYPVAKGGLSTRQNLVFICFQCNSKKSDMTLAAFIRKHGLCREAVESRLAALGKDF